MGNYTYDVPAFRKKLIQRTGMVVLVFLLFLGINFHQVSPESQESFLTMFVVLGGLLIFLLVKNYSRQLKTLEGSKVELSGNSLKQWNPQGQCMEFDLREVNGIEKDTFRGYQRILLITKQGTYIPILNLQSMDEFLSELEKKSGKKAAVFEEDSRVLTWKTPLAFIPTFGTILAYLFGPWHLKQDAIYIVATANTLLFLLYWPKDRMNTGQTARRRYIFILLILLIVLIARYFGLI
ncbi:hypothetical protein LEP1GSC050_2090 [Leptospira broomii serovar Hurstbridge str. 5399]|uniref:Uncharacterized protein n=1 Tax=Leptospira broomii serovar Hurstbridge str. 5399 TaxID=1049789 RepID=T0FE31_9LEPT|nr:hypothetical protein [Leptospira broomii]EQA46101.1 hypothetical protein LEP1GSC050_2090 [Leptospira broomii serovar Hurstbridge str. 5399]